MDLGNFKLILGSKSPRRSELLTKAGIPFEIKAIDTDESYPSDLALDDIAEFIANKKLAPHKATLAENELVLTADTIVVYENKVYGKPIDKQEAIDTVMKFSGKEHIVYTGVCLYSKTMQLSFTEQSLVTFAQITQEEAMNYVETFEPLDKAGAYGIQDWIGYAKVASITGSYTNILGLPLAQTYDALLRFTENK